MFLGVCASLPNLAPLGLGAELSKGDLKGRADMAAHLIIKDLGRVLVG